MHIISNNLRLSKNLDAGKANFSVHLLANLGYRCSRRLLLWARMHAGWRVRSRGVLPGGGGRGGNLVGRTAIFPPCRIEEGISIMSDPILGMIMLWPGNWVPYGWALCDGTQMPIQQNSALFTILGTLYGGNGSTTFNLPNLNGRVAVGTSAATGVSQTGGGTTAS